jgi:small subunit ribosomal protein S2
MGKITTKELLNAGVHFGHLTRKWDPRMAPYIFMEKNGIHIIDLNKTVESLEKAKTAIAQIARSGRKIMFVATKKQAQVMVSEEAKRLKMPYVTERWLGGMLTNFATVRKSIKRMTTIEKMEKDADFEANIAKRERLMLSREKEKLARVIGGIAELNRLPAALFIIDIKKEHLAVKEAHKLGLPVFALVDTNSNPDEADFPIPGNDDSANSIEIILKQIGEAIEAGLNDRKKEKDDKNETDVETVSEKSTENVEEA